MNPELSEEMFFYTSSSGYNPGDSIGRLAGRGGSASSRGECAARGMARAQMSDLAPWHADRRLVLSTSGHVNVLCGSLIGLAVDE